MEVTAKTAKVSYKATMPHRKNGAAKEKVGNEDQREQESCGEKMGNTEKQASLKL
ncbi:MAG: hypothetical protein QMD13_06230 [Candidatus Bathyarchaeia archaeon]|nr:hypothetical protein [Candidatus Bathyarchaeia archaeon]